VKQLGLKNIMAADAVLIHYESKSRGTADKHPADTALFKERYAALIESGDPYFNPQLRADNTLMSVLAVDAEAKEYVPFRTVSVVPPKTGTQA
jgi:hypothetical protein